jgi:hypothetical protein
MPPEYAIEYVEMVFKPALDRMAHALVRGCQVHSLRSMGWQ